MGILIILTKIKLNEIIESLIPLKEFLKFWRVLLKRLRVESWDNFVKSFSKKIKSKIKIRRAVAPSLVIFCTRLHHTAISPIELYHQLNVVWMMALKY
jgi:hypothetical protein